MNELEQLVKKIAKTEAKLESLVEEYQSKCPHPDICEFGYYWDGGRRYCVDCEFSFISVYPLPEKHGWDDFWGPLKDQRGRRIVN